MGGFDLRQVQQSSQRQGQEQTQRLAARQIQGLGLLQKPDVELGQYVREELRNNPLVDDVLDGDRLREEPLDGAPSGESDGGGGGSVPESELLEFKDSDLDRRLNANGWREGQDNWDGSGGSSADGSEPSANEIRLSHCVQTETLANHLLGQINTSDIRAEDRELARALIGSFDEDGYFREGSEDIQMVFGVGEEKVAAVLAHVLKFDPLGCGARNVRECLLAQLIKLDDSPWHDAVRDLIVRHWETVAEESNGVSAERAESDRWAKVREAMGLSSADFEQALAALRTLDPRPGRRFVPVDYLVVEPDVEVAKIGGKWVVGEPRYAFPKIVYNKEYRRQLEKGTGSAEELKYLKDCNQRIETLRELVGWRNDTIGRLAQAIVDEQVGFFEKGPRALRPLTQAYVARKIGVNDGTVSRAVGSKYMSTPWGTVSFSQFFGAGTSTKDGGVVRRDEVLDRLREIVSCEDPANPYTDDVLRGKLEAQGIAISRRTVVKYREQAKIPSRRDRRVSPDVQKPPHPSA